jgi:hypothetical protein
MQQPELWIGLVEVKPLDRKAYGAAGAFTNIVTWACDIEEIPQEDRNDRRDSGHVRGRYRGAAPLADRIKAWSLPEEIEDMVLRVESNQNAIVYGTFHRYPFDEA